MVLMVCAAVTPSEARDKSTVMDAMHDELVRSMMELKLDGLATPYHIEYTLTKRSRVAAHAILGIVDDIDTGRTATLTVKVRVGTPKFDNTNFFDVSLGFATAASRSTSAMKRCVVNCGWPLTPATSRPLRSMRRSQPL
jgi:hypothetical protein